MLSRLFGKSDSSTVAPGHALDTRGLEVIEDDSETAWEQWSQALLQRDQRRRALRAANAETPVGHPQPTELQCPPQSTPPIQNALRVVHAQHSQIARTIVALWGYPEGGQYLNRLLIEGSDSTGSARVAFSSPVVQALLALTQMHDVHAHEARYL